MFINFQVDEQEMQAIQKSGVEIQGLIAMLTQTLGGKAKVGEFEIPTVSIKKVKRFGNLALDCSPKALNLAVTVEPQFTADVIDTYTFVYASIAIPVVALIVALAAMDNKMEAAEKELKKKWLTEPKKKTTKKAA